MEIQLSDLREEILKMSSLVEAALKSAARQESTQEEVSQYEDQINSCHTSIDDHCFKYLALMRPAATDLRTIIAIMKMNNELERIGDEIVSISRHHDLVSSKGTTELQTMTQEVSKMLRQVMDSFVSQKVKTATRVIQNDHVVNDLNRSVIQSSFESVKNHNLSVDEGFNLARVAKSLERIGDHTTNIAEDVIFLVSGDDIRHSPERPRSANNDNGEKKS